jgi:GNAT superfamily N-acetyltransferase
MTGISIRELRREDFSLVRNLYAATKNRLRPEAHDYWCFFDTPWGDSPAVIALDGDLCAGLFVLRPTMFKLGGEDVLGGQAVDLMTHPDYRRRGLFVALFEESMRIAASHGYEMVYAFPNEKGKSYPGFVYRLNLDHVGDVFSWNYNIRSFRLPLPAWGRLKGTSIVAGEDDIRPGELETLIKTSEDEREVCRIKRNQTWLTWRYAKASSEMYRWHTGRDSAGVIQAALLVGERDESWGGLGKGVLRIHEAFAHFEDALVALLTVLIHRAKVESKTVVKMFVKDAQIESALRKAKFKPAESLPLVVRKLTARRFGGNVHHFPAWRIVGGDIDAF